MTPHDDGDNGADDAPEPDKRRTLPSASMRLSQLAGRSGIPGSSGLGGLESGGLEGVGGLGAGRIATSLEQLDAILRYDVVENPDTGLGKEEADRFLATARDALHRLAADGQDAQLSAAHHAGLEAVVETDGSFPSIPFKDGTLDQENPRLGDWAIDVNTFGAAIDRAARATGRILQDGDMSDLSVKGTAFMIAPGLAATAKHVIESIASEHQGQWILKFGHEYTFDCSVEHGRPSRPDERIKIRSIRWVSPDRIDGRLDLTNLDMAILELEDEGPRPLVGTADLGQIGPPPYIHVIGHPRRLIEGDLGLDPEFEMIKALVFGNGFGVKRWSPGAIQIGPGGLSQDAQTAHVLTHNASTLGGNSGSPLLDFTTIPDRLIGLHYGGYFGDENYAHCSQPFAAPLVQAGATFI